MYSSEFLRKTPTLLVLLLSLFYYDSAWASNSGSGNVSMKCNMDNMILCDGMKTEPGLLENNDVIDLGTLFSRELSSVKNFEQAVDIASGSVSGVSSMDAGDIDQDGFGDIISIEGGKHAGGRKSFAWFRAPTSINGSWTRHNFGNDSHLRSFLGSAKLADMDGDNDLDLIVSSDNHSGGSRQADVYVYVNPGLSNVTNSWNYVNVTPSTLALHHVNDMEVADMDGDGKNDIVVRSLTPNQIHIFFQDDIDTYEHKIIETNISASEGLSVGYLDTDNIRDISYTGFWLKSPADPRSQDYFLRNIDSNYKNENQNTKEAIGDIDGDGFNDVIISPAEYFRGGGDTDLAWYKNPGNNSSANWQKNVILANTNNTHTVKLGDMDNDGDLDVVTGICWTNNGHTISVNVYCNDGQGGFGNSMRIETGKGLYSGVVYDIDGDSDLDIIGQNIYSNNSKPFVYENSLNSINTDCNGVDNGSAYIDDCGVCVGGNTGLNPCVSGTTGVQAENYCSATGIIESAHSGYTGSGYFNFDNFTGSNISWKINASVAGSYAFSILFAHSNNSTSRPMDVEVNGVIQETYPGAGTGSGWTNWDTETRVLSLIQGVNEIRLVAKTSNGGVNLDMLTWSDPEISITSCSGTSTDCNGDIGGSAFLDDCGNCVGGNTGEIACTLDCNGDENGSAFLDDCGNCVGGNTGELACTIDCHGDENGTSYIDACGVCVGGNTGLEPCSTITATKYQIFAEGGDIGVESALHGVILKAPNGTCFRIKVNNAGGLITELVDCEE